jgi:hypothetical protein
MVLLIFPEKSIELLFLTLIKSSPLKHLEADIGRGRNLAVGLSRKRLIFADLIIDLAITGVFFV